MRRTFSVSSAYDPTYSLLGRALRSSSLSADRPQAEALYVVVLTGLFAILLIGHYLGWTLVRPALADAGGWQHWFWGGQTALGLLLAAVGLIGFRPAVRVTCTDNAVDLSQGTRTRHVELSAIRDATDISAQQYHRHYRRYAATEAFVSRRSDRVLLLRTDDGPIVVALPDPEARETVHHHLQAATDPPGP